MLLIAGNSHPGLAQAIACNLQAPLIIAETKKFNDQELLVQIHAELKEQTVVLIQSISDPVNDQLMELLLMADIAKQGGAKHIIAVIPYLGYSRQDKASPRLGAGGLSLVARLFKTAGVDKIVTVDAHPQNVQKSFKIEIQNLDPFPLFIPHLKDIKDFIVVAPDTGGIPRAQAFAKMLNLDLAFINKRRLPNGGYKIAGFTGSVKGKNCLLLDDIIDSGGTLIGAGKLLLQKEAQSVSAFITHGVFSKTPAEEIDLGLFQEFYITNSLKLGELPAKIKVISIVDLIIPALKFLS